MKKNTEALKHAVNKGQILHLLRPEYPEYIDFIVLRQAMANMGKPLTEKSFAGYLHYLDEAGYVELKKDEEFHILCVRLTNKGLNIIDGWIKDPAVMVK